MLFQNVYTKSIIQTSMPKAGTHLLRKCISLLTDIPLSQAHHGSSFYFAKSNEFAWETQHAKHWITHLFYNKEFEPFLNNEQSAIFFIYRDPRDQIISFAHYMLSDRSYPWYADAKALSFDDLILALILDGEIYKGHPPCENINDLYQSYMPWFSAPHVCSLCFEDLIGPNGGGNLEKQLETIKKIASHLDITVDDETVKNVARNLFGASPTFRRGKIGDWKIYFKKHHKQEFKKIAGQLLIDLGYEKDFNW